MFGFQLIKHHARCGSIMEGRGIRYVIFLEIIILSASHQINRKDEARQKNMFTIRLAQAHYGLFLLQYQQVPKSLKSDPSARKWSKYNPAQ
jgi:hypothetical protein